MTNELKRYLDNLIRRIILAIPVEEIILFGSHAYGSTNKDSDIDLCILSKLDGKRKIDLVKQSRRAISPIAFNPVDILIYDKDDFAKRANVVSTLEHKIKKEGIKIYGK